LSSLQDITKLLMASCHIGTKNMDNNMKKYVYKRRQDGTNIIDLHKTWEKLLIAARAVVAIENPKDVFAISGREFGTRAVLKFAGHVGARGIAGRYTPGTFTNQIQKAFCEPRLIIVTDPRQDHQPVRETSYVNVPTIALCNTDSPIRYIDVAIPCNNTSVTSIGLMWWLLAREVLRFRGAITRAVPWDVMVDLYFYRDPEDVAKQEEERALKDAEAKYPAAAEGFQQDWGAAAPAAAEEWTAAAPAAVQQYGAPAAEQDWGAAAPAQDWGAAPAAGAGAGWEGK
jgi:small subunit ribosomal protein SAe